MVLKVSTTVDEKLWKEFRGLSKETHQSLSGMLNEALEDYLNKKKIRPKFLKAMNESLRENQELGKLLAK